MRYVILRDDDTNALTPIECLETLFRPFLDRGMPVNLSVIPNVKTTVCLPNGEPERYLFEKRIDTPGLLPIGSNKALVRYLRENSGYQLLQHGYHHEMLEFLSLDRADLANRITAGKKCFIEAGLTKPRTFVAPQDRISKEALIELVGRFSAISTHWFERSQIPLHWWPQYLTKKILKRRHWTAGGALLISRPKQEIICTQPYDIIFDRVRQLIENQPLTVLATHWWDFFRQGQKDEALINVYHQIAEYLAKSKDIKVISFGDLIDDPSLFKRLM